MIDPYAPPEAPTPAPDASMPSRLIDGAKTLLIWLIFAATTLMFWRYMLLLLDSFEFLRAHVGDEDGLVSKILAIGGTRLAAFFGGVALLFRRKWALWCFLAVLCQLVFQATRSDSGGVPLMLWLLVPVLAFVLHLRKAGDLR